GESREDGEGRWDKDKLPDSHKYEGSAQEPDFVVTLEMLERLQCRRVTSAWRTLGSAEGHIPGQGLYKVILRAAVCGLSCGGRLVSSVRIVKQRIGLHIQPSLFFTWQLVHGKLYDLPLS
ncbi:hypothetical protein GDO81_029460, partial [Engystomops pustulosus]